MCQGSDQVLLSQLSTLCCNNVNILPLHFNRRMVSCNNVNTGLFAQLHVPAPGSAGAEEVPADFRTVRAAQETTGGTKL
jgi:hypothetical protein